MGHKVNPVGLRLGVNRTWDSRWYSDGSIATSCSRTSRSASSCTSA